MMPEPLDDGSLGERPKLVVPGDGDVITPAFTGAWHRSPPRSLRHREADESDKAGAA